MVHTYTDLWNASLSFAVVQTCRAEAERLLLQQKATCLDAERQQLTDDVHTLQQQLAAAHSAFLQASRQTQQLSSANAALQLQVEAAVQEYRANDIICCGLRDTISRLQRRLGDTQETCSKQVCSRLQGSNTLLWSRRLSVAIKPAQGLVWQAPVILLL